MVTDYALFTLAHLGGISFLQQGEEAAKELPARTNSQATRGAGSGCEEAADADAIPSSVSSVFSTPVDVAGAVTSNGSVNHCCEWRGAGSHRVLTRGKKDTREENSEEEENEEDGEVCEKEAMKVLCNIIYNSPRAQERVSTLR